MVSVLETLALGWAAEVTGAAALTTQTITSVADIAASVFLLVGVVSSGRAADERHPLGYGRERFFWSLMAAVGIFLGGFGTAAAETVEAIAHPHAAGAYSVGYTVIAVTVVLDTVALLVAIRPLLRAARQRSSSLRRLLWRSTDPAVTTVVLSSGAGVTGGLLAAAGLAGSQLSGRSGPDAAASALIGLVLLATSLVLLHANRELLTGRGLGPLQVAQMRGTVLEQAGVLAVPDLFGVVVGPSSWIVDSDVVFDDSLDVPAIETVIVDAASALRLRWPAIRFVYLNPVAAGRPRDRRQM